MGNPQSGQDARAPPAVSRMLRAFLPLRTFGFALVAAGFQLAGVSETLPNVQLSYGSASGMH